MLTKKQWYIISLISAIIVAGLLFTINNNLTNNSVESDTATTTEEAVFSDTDSSTNSTEVETVTVIEYIDNWFEDTDKIDALNEELDELKSELQELNSSNSSLNTLKTTLEARINSLIAEKDSYKVKYCASVRGHFDEDCGYTSPSSTSIRETMPLRDDTGNRSIRSLRTLR